MTHQTEMTILGLEKMIQTLSPWKLDFQAKNHGPSGFVSFPSSQASLAGVSLISENHHSHSAQILYK